MTPNEKAEELVKKMYLVHSNSASAITMYFAKQCTLICVDEMLQHLDDRRYEWDIWSDDKEFYEQVKQEIKNL